jgi:hypothetical protein
MRAIRRAVQGKAAAVMAGDNSGSPWIGVRLGQKVGTNVPFIHTPQ